MAITFRSQAVAINLLTISDAIKINVKVLCAPVPAKCLILPRSELTLSLQCQLSEPSAAVSNSVLGELLCQQTLCILREHLILPSPPVLHSKK